MPHFLIKNEQKKDNYIIVANDDNFFHITKVLRAKTGEIIKFIDENQILYISKVAEISKKELKAKVIKQELCDRILNYDVSLIQSILAFDAQNLAIANATQSGVNEIYPVLSDNVQNKKILKDKIDKWKKIAYENFKQCERANLPNISEINELKSILKLFKKNNILIFAEKYANCEINKAVENINKKEKIAIVIGPEGGFSENEFDYFINNNYNLISLGKMIYKAPNAIVAGISNVVSRL